MTGVQTCALPIGRHDDIGDIRGIDNVVIECKNENKLETCHHCGKQKQNCYHGFIALTIPHPKMEEKIEKWGRSNWWENLERTDLTSEQIKELDDICSYDQALNTIGRGIQCDDCGRKEAELYEKYYPKHL